MNQLTKMSWLIVTSAVLAGCATPYPAEPKPSTPPVNVIPPPAPVEPVLPEPPPPPPVAVPVEPPLSEKNLAIALASYERGDYAGAMKQLSPLTTDTALDKPDRLKAIKSLAFAQCLTRAVVACRKSFERAFQLDPKFSLAPAEQGHPVWGPQFDLARKNMKIK